jgi:Tfp pilus assembly protein PilE
MAGMKRPQFTLRLLIAITAIAAIWFSIYFSTIRRNEAELRTAATKAYLAEHAFIEKYYGIWPQAAMEQTIKNQEDRWKKQYSWPLPEIPAAR